MSNIDNIISIAKDLIAVESTHLNEPGLEEAIDLVESYLDNFQPDINFKTFRESNKPSLIAYNSKSLPQGGFKVLLNGHLDVVPASSSQFKLVINGDKLIGRGALDMKLGLAVLLDSFTRIAPKLSTPIGLQVVSDEEIGGKLGTKVQKQSGIRTEFFLTGESTSLQICDESKGVCHIRLKAQASSSHSAYQWEGRSLLDEALEVVQNLRKKYPLTTTKTSNTTVTVADISTDNKVFNKSPGLVEVNLDVRYKADDPNFSSRNSVKEFLKEIKGNFVEEIVELEPAHKVHEHVGVEYLEKLKESTQKITNLPAKTIKKPGASDARYYGTDSTAVAFGLDGIGLHSDHEYATKKSLEQYSKIIDDFLISLG